MGFEPAIFNWKADFVAPPDGHPRCGPSNVPDFTAATWSSSLPFNPSERVGSLDHHDELKHGHNQRDRRDTK